MTKIYDQHRAAFSNVSAYVILNNQGEKVATIALKFPRDGAGRLYAYVHWLGTEMVRGFAGGYGYDKRSAAVVSAVNSLAFIKGLNTAVSEGRMSVTASGDFHTFRAACASAEGEYFDRALEKAGFTVLQAV